MKRTTTALLLALAGPACAQDRNCAPQEVMQSYLKNEHSEARVIEGFTRTAIMHFWVSDAGTWSVTVTSASGVSCMIASGTDVFVMPVGEKG